MRTSTLQLVSLVLAFAIHAASAAEPFAPLSELGVDQVKLRKGPRLLGAVLDRANDGGVTIAVRRGWLRKNQPKLFETCELESIAEQEAGLKQVRDRIEEWSERSADEPRLAFFLKKQAERLDAALADNSGVRSSDDGDFLLIVLDAAQIERVHVQPVARKQIASLAWREKLDDVESRSAKSLDRDLKKSGFDVTRERADLSDRLPVRRQSGEEWAARQALIEYELRKSIDFQGTVGRVIRTGEGAKPPPVADLMADALKEQLAASISELQPVGTAARPQRDSEVWLKSATDLVDRDGGSGFRVTRVTTDPMAKRASVEARFVARMPGGTWKTIWQQTETVEADRADKDRVERISRDPQVRQVLELFQSAGLKDGQAQLQSALRYGAATMQAQEAADARFVEFRERYLQRVEGPPLKIGLDP